MPQADLVIATRGSRLALTQTNAVADLLRAAHPGLTVAIRELTTTGDRRRDVPLPEVGGKGLFTKELEQALLSGEADLAVHSLKDLPTELPAGLTLAAVPARECPFDAVVLPAGSARGEADPLGLLPAGATVGTGSVRRVAFLRHVRPDLDLQPVRGNVDTRLRKLDEGQFHALVLAAAGLRRLGFGERITALVPLEVAVPAPGQGALGLEARADDHRVLSLLAPLEDAAVRAAVTAERSLLEALGGGCNVPCGAYAEPHGDGLLLTAAVASPDGTARLQRAAVGAQSEAAALGKGLATALLAAGADRLVNPCT